MTDYVIWSGLFNNLVLLLYTTYSQRQMPRPSRSTRSAPVVIAAGAVKRPNRTAKRVVRQSSETEKAKRDVEPEPKLLGAPSLLPPILHFSLSEAVSHLSTHDRRFGTMFDRIPCKPFAPPYEPIDPFRTLVTSIIGQQVSWLAARAINKRFQALFGYDDGFPTPWEITKKEPLELKGVGLSMRKAEYGELHQDIAENSHLSGGAFCFGRTIDGAPGERDRRGGRQGANCGQGDRTGE